MKRLIYSLVFSLFLIGCGPKSPNAIVNDLCLIQITDNTERMQEFVAKTYTVDFTTSTASDHNGMALHSVKYTQISFTEYNAATVYLNLGRNYKVIIAPIATHGELVEIQNRLGKNFAADTVEPEPTIAPPPALEN